MPIIGQFCAADLRRTWNSDVHVVLNVRFARISLLIISAVSATFGLCFEKSLLPNVSATYAHIRLEAHMPRVTL